MPKGFICLQYYLIDYRGKTSRFKRFHYVKIIKCEPLFDKQYNGKAVVGYLEHYRSKRSYILQSQRSVADGYILLISDHILKVESQCEAAADSHFQSQIHIAMPSPESILVLIIQSGVIFANC